MGKRESWLLCLVCLPGVSLLLGGSSSRCNWVCLQFVIVVFPDHTHLLFLKTTLGLIACFQEECCEKVDVVLLTIHFIRSHGGQNGQTLGL